MRDPDSRFLDTSVEPSLNPSFWRLGPGFGPGALGVTEFEESMRRPNVWLQEASVNPSRNPSFWYAVRLVMMPAPRSVYHLLRRSRRELVGFEFKHTAAFEIKRGQASPNVSKRVIMTTRTLLTFLQHQALDEIELLGDRWQLSDRRQFYRLEAALSAPLPAHTLSIVLPRVAWRAAPADGKRRCRPFS